MTVRAGMSASPADRRHQRHTSPLARRAATRRAASTSTSVELARQLGARGCEVDIFSRVAEQRAPEVADRPGLRAIHLSAGPARYLAPESIRTSTSTTFAEPSSISRRDEGIGTTTSSTATTGSPASSAIGLQEAWGVPHVAMFHTLGESQEPRRVR